MTYFAQSTYTSRASTHQQSDNRTYCIFLLKLTLRNTPNSFTQHNLSKSLQRIFQRWKSQQDATFSVCHFRPISKRTVHYRYHNLKKMLIVFSMSLVNFCLKWWSNKPFRWTCRREWNRWSCRLRWIWACWRGKWWLTCRKNC